MLSVIIGNSSYSLDDGTLCRLVGFDGWGMAPQHRIETRGPLQHGVTDRGYRLDPRLGTLILQLVTTTLADMYDRRETLISLFKPSNNPKLKWELPNGTTKQIDCFYHEDMSLEWVPDNWGAQRLAVTLKCPDPTFYNPVMNNVSFGISAGGTGFAIPWEIPWTIGSSAINQTRVITYLGSHLSYPTIKIHGPITSPTITNEATGETLSFPGVTIALGDWYEIDTRYGYKTVTDQAGASKISELSDGSDLATFHIADSPEAPGGVNTLLATGTAASTATQIYMTYYTRYAGL